MLNPLVAIIIINNNRRDDTLACLASLEQTVYPNKTTILLDVNSTDGSISAVRSKFPEIQVIQLKENLGFAGNNNIGMRLAMEQKAEWLFILNEDTIIDSDCISRLVAEGEMNCQIGILGPMVYHHDEPNVIQSAGGNLDQYWNSTHLANNEVDLEQVSEPHAVDFISGCGILVRSSMINQIGMLDERFFCYYEETEWCLRARKAGWQIMQIPQAKMWHKGVQRDYHPMPYVTYYMTRNRFLMFSIHKAPWHVWIAASIQVLRTLVSWTIKPKWRSMLPHRDAMFRGVADFLFKNWGEMGMLQNQRFPLLERMSAGK